MIINIEYITIFFYGFKSCIFIEVDDLWISVLKPSYSRDRKENCARLFLGLPESVCLCAP